MPFSEHEDSNTDATRKILLLVTGCILAYLHTLSLRGGVSSLFSPSRYPCVYSLQPPRLLQTHASDIDVSTHRGGKVLILTMGEWGGTTVRCLTRLCPAACPRSRSPKGMQYLGSLPAR